MARLLCTGRLIRHPDRLAVTIQSPLPTALTYALWARFAAKLARTSMPTDATTPYRSTFTLYDDAGALAIGSPATIELDPQAMRHSTEVRPYA